MGIADAVAENNEVRGQQALVLRCKDINCLLQRLFELCLHNLLALPLHDVLTIVLAELFIGTCGEANDRVGPRMTHINTDQHRSHIVHSLRELQVEQVTLDLRVDLAKNVGSFTHVELETIASGDDLGWDLELVEQLLVHLVVVLLAENNDDDLWVSEHTVRTIHHIIKHLALDLGIVIFRLQLDEVRLLNSDLQGTRSLHKRIVNRVGYLEVRALPRVWPLRILIDHDPFFLKKVDSFLDRETFESLLAALDNLT